MKRQIRSSVYKLCLVSGKPDQESEVRDFTQVFYHCRFTLEEIILGGKKHDHVTDHLIKLHWLPISQRRIFKILLLVFKALNGQGPIYLAEMLVPCSNSEHDLRSSYDNLLVVPATDSVTYGDRAFSVLGPSLWNNLPKKIQCSCSVPSFKSALKTHLFKQSFGV